MELESPNTDNPALRLSPGLEATAETATAARFRDWLAWVMRGGVLLASACCVLGLALSLSRGAMPVAFGGDDLAVGLGSRLAAGDPTALVALGIIILALVPVARVVFSLAHFIRERDTVYTVLTSCVLALLALGVWMS